MTPVPKALAVKAATYAADKASELCYEVSCLLTDMGTAYADCDLAEVNNLLALVRWRMEAFNKAWHEMEAAERLILADEGIKQ